MRYRTVFFQSTDHGYWSCSQCLIITSTTTRNILAYASLYIVTGNCWVVGYEQAQLYQLLLSCPPKELYQVTFLSAACVRPRGDTSLTKLGFIRILIFFPIRWVQISIWLSFLIGISLIFSEIEHLTSLSAILLFRELGFIYFDHLSTRLSLVFQ